jgi:hypothetical protein
VPGAVNTLIAGSTRPDTTPVTSPASLSNVDSLERHQPACGGAAGSCTVTRSPPAADLASLSAQQAPAEGVEAQALSRVARSEVCSLASEHDHAVELAREAVDLVPDTMPNLLGEALWTLGRVLAVANLPGADSAR